MVFVSPRALAVSALALTCSTVLAEIPQCNTMATDGYYHIVNVRSSKPISMDPDTKNIYQGTTATDFQLIPTSDGYYRIVSKSGFDMTCTLQPKTSCSICVVVADCCTNLSCLFSKNILPAEARSHLDGANVIGEPLEPGNQLFEWCFTTRGTDGYEIYNRLNTRSLDGTMSGGYNVLQWGWWGGLSKLFFLVACCSEFFVPSLGNPVRSNQNCLQTRSGVSIQPQVTRTQRRLQPLRCQRPQLPQWLSLPSVTCFPGESTLRL